MPSAASAFTTASAVLSSPDLVLSPGLVSSVGLPVMILSVAGCAAVIPLSSVLALLVSLPSLPLTAAVFAVLRLDRLVVGGLAIGRHGRRRGRVGRLGGIRGRLLRGLRRWVGTRLRGVVEQAVEWRGLPGPPPERGGAGSARGITLGHGCGIGRNLRHG